MSIENWDDDAKKYLNRMIEYSIKNTYFVTVWQCNVYRKFCALNYDINIRLSQSDEALQLVREQSYGVKWDIDELRRLRNFPIQNGDALLIFLRFENLYDECEMLLEFIKRVNIRKIIIHICGSYLYDEIYEYAEIIYKNIANIGKTQVEYYIPGNIAKITEPS